MITFERDGSVVKTKVDAGHLGATYPMTYDCGNTYYAKLLYYHLDDLLDKRIEAIRKEEYERGFNDHKKRKPKSDFFTTSMNTGKYWND